MDRVIGAEQHDDEVPLRFNEVVAMVWLARPSWRPGSCFAAPDERRARVTARGLRPIGGDPRPPRSG
jgi:hypothetical protein